MFFPKQSDSNTPIDSFRLLHHCHPIWSSSVCN